MKPFELETANCPRNRPTNQATNDSFALHQIVSYQGYLEKSTGKMRSHVYLRISPLLVCTSFKWGRRYQEEELASLREEMDRVSREVEAEIKRLQDREDIIRGIRDEQLQVPNP